MIGRQTIQKEMILLLLSNHRGVALALVGISFLGWCVWQDKSKVQMKADQIISQAKQKNVLSHSHWRNTHFCFLCLRFPSYLLLLFWMKWNPCTSIIIFFFFFLSFSMGFFSFMSWNYFFSLFFVFLIQNYLNSWLTQTSSIN